MSSCKTVLSTLLSELENIRDNGPRRCEIGICRNVGLECRPVLKRFFLKWPLCVDPDGVHPVPASLKDSSIENAMNIYNEQYDVWDMSTEYGQLRWELLDFMISEIEKEVRLDIE